MSTRSTSCQGFMSGWSGQMLAFVFAGLALLVSPTATWGFGNSPAELTIEQGETVMLQLDGLGAAGTLVVQDALFGTPGVATTNVGGGQTKTGANSVLINITGSAVGNTTVQYSGTFRGTNVNTTVTVHVVPKGTTVGRQPWIASGGDPVSTATGEYFAIEATDFDLGGPMPLRFMRYTASKLAADGRLTAGLGQNRLHNFASRMQVTAFNRRDVLLPNGRIVTFQKTGAKWNLVKPLDVPYVLAELAGNFIFADPGAHQMWTYNALGQLTKIEDGKGNTHTLAYAGGNLALVTDGLGRTLTLAYTGGNISSVTDQSARQVLFNYTGSVLTSATDVGGHITTYGNDGGLPVSVTQPAGNLLFSQTFTDGKVTSQTERATDVSTFAYGAGSTVFTNPIGGTLVDNYNTSGQLTSHTDESGKAIQMTNDAAGRRTTVTDREGDTTSIAYNPLTGRPATIINAEGKVGTVTYKPRVLNGVTFQDIAKVAYPDLSTESYLHDAKGNLTQITDQAAKVWKYEYNARGQVLKATNPLGGVTTFTYDLTTGRPLTRVTPDGGTVSYAYDTAGRLNQITNPGATTFQLNYDTEGRVTSIKDEGDNTYGYTYDSNDRLTVITDPNAGTTSFGYDALNRIISGTDRTGKSASITYNSRHLPATVTDRNNFTVALDYDALQRLTAITDPQTRVWTQGYDNEGLLTSVGIPGAPLGTPPGSLKRNRMGRVTEISNPLGDTMRFVRDAMQRVTQVFDPLGRQTIFAYDKRGLVTSISEQGGVACKYDRNALGQISKITDPIGSAWSIGYTPSGRMQSLTDPLNRKWMHTYNNRGQRTGTIFPGGGTGAFTFDAAGNLITRVYSDGTTLIFDYDEINRLIAASNLQLTRDAEGRIVNTRQHNTDFGATYDNGGRLATATYFNNALVVNYDYDPNNRVTQISDNVSNAQVDFEYDASGHMIGIMRSNGVNGTFGYDLAGRRKSIAEGVFLDLQYSLNPAGQVVNVNYTAPIVPAVVAGMQTFKYDKASQLSQAGYGYDMRGRVTALPGQTYNWDAATRLIDANSVLLQYDGLGNVTQRTNGADVSRFYHNYAIRNAPLVYDDPQGAGDDISYVYTPDGHLIYSVNMTSHLPTFYHFDRQGSTLALTNAAGVVTDSYSYSPTGERHQEGTGNSAQPFTYRGRWGVRAEGSLYQIGGRYYDPVSGSYLSRDFLSGPQPDVEATNPYYFNWSGRDVAPQLPATDADGGADWAGGELDWLDQLYDEWYGDCDCDDCYWDEWWDDWYEYWFGDGCCCDDCWWEFDSYPPESFALFPAYTVPLADWWLKFQGHGSTTARTFARIRSDWAAPYVASWAAGTFYNYNMALLQKAAVYQTTEKETRDEPYIPSPVYNISTGPDPAEQAAEVAAITQAHLQGLEMLHRSLQAVGQSLIDKATAAGFGNMGKQFMDQFKAVREQQKTIGKVITALGGTVPVYEN